MMFCGLTAKKENIIMLMIGGGSAVVAEDKQGKIYLVGQSRYPADNIFSWEIIMGGFRKGADPLKVAKKELEEEAGVRAGKWVSLGYCYPNNGIASEIFHIYYARELSPVKTNFEGTEDIIIKKKSPKEILKMIKKNEITCGITIFATAKYLMYKNKIKL
jgi:ADP-ribose pyrophosphatase